MSVDKVAVALVPSLLYLGGVIALDVNRLNFTSFKHADKAVVRALIVDLGGSCKLIRYDESDDDKKYHADDDECASCGWFHLSS